MLLSDSVNEWPHKNVWEPVGFNSLDECINYCYNAEYSCSIRTGLLGPPKKKHKVEEELVSPITFGLMNASLGKAKPKMKKYY